MMSAPSAWAIENAMAALARALTDEPDPETGEFVPVETAEADVNALLHRVLRAAVEAKSMADMVKTRMDDLAERRDRFLRRAETLRASAFACMDVMQLRKLELPDITVSLKSNPPRVEISDEDALPEEYVRWTRAADKTAIKAALQAGQDVPGATLSNQPPSLTIRTR